MRQPAYQNDLVSIFSSRPQQWASSSFIDVTDCGLESQKLQGKQKPEAASDQSLVRKGKVAIQIRR